MPDMNMMNTPRPNPDDREAAMARADLYKLANYSMKLFKMIHDGDQLEGWVQAKVTKAADYIASVYHFMEYEMKFSEYGDKLERSDMYTEEVRQQFKEKLMEAKTKLDKLKKKNEKDLDEAFDDKAKVGDTKKTRTGVATKTDTGVIHKNTSYADDGESEQKSGKGKASHAKTQSAAEKKSQAPKLKQSPKSAKTWGMKDNEKFDNRDKVKEGMFGNDEASLAKKSPQLQQLIALRGTPKYSTPEGKKALELRIKAQMDRVSLDKGEVAGKDGKPVKVESKSEKFDALKHVKNPTKGEKDAAKDVKRGSYADRAAMLKSAEKDGRLKEALKGGQKKLDTDKDGKLEKSDFAKLRAGKNVKEAAKPDFLDMDKDGNKKEPMKKAVADKKAPPKKGVNPFAKK
jgi:hypothetical protein